MRVLEARATQSIVLDSKIMASKSEISSLEEILEKHLPETELAEAKRILYGRQLE